MRTLLFAAALALAATACKKANPDYCCTGADCAEPRACPDGKFCDNDGAFGDLENSCIDAPGATCSDEEPCGGDAPICHEGLCVQCTAAEDCGASAPVCGDDMSCGACAGDQDCQAHAAAPVCGEDGACGPCVAGADCASGVCDAAGGGCVAPADILHVESGADGADCTAEAPCGSIQQAIDLAAGDRVWIRVAEGSYAETLTLHGVTARIVADGADLVPGDALVSAVLVTGAADVLIEGLRIHAASGTGAGGDGIHCTNAVDSPVLAVRRAIIEDNADEGIEAISCSVEVTQTVLRRNDGGAITLEGSDFALINDFIYENGPDEPGGVSIRGNPPGGAGAARLEHNTIVRNGGPEASISGVTCS